jgi:hypothetical protein
MANTESISTVNAQRAIVFHNVASLKVFDWVDLK